MSIARCRQYRAHPHSPGSLEHDCEQWKHSLEVGINRYVYSNALAYTYHELRQPARHRNDNGRSPSLYYLCIGQRQLLLSEASTPTRSSDTRGRKNCRATSSGALGATPSTRPKPPPKQFSMNHQSPSKDALSRKGQQQQEYPGPSGHQGAVAGQGRPELTFSASSFWLPKPAHQSTSYPPRWVSQPARSQHPETATLTRNYRESCQRTWI